MRKEKMFAMRMSQQDYDRIQHKAGQAGMSMTGFLTASALDKKIVVVDGVDKVLGELKAIGRNLNQVTTLCNMGKITCLDLTEIKKGFGTVFDTLYDLMDRG
ncbi:MAG: MobC family plasmid mobilization relaxosome protein [Clostridia bacterium]|nr:MobC family plasmid mobilization relaxosome protein [Clostridia bacterium]